MDDDAILMAIDAVTTFDLVGIAGVCRQATNFRIVEFVGMHSSWKVGVTEGNPRGTGRTAHAVNVGLLAPGMPGCGLEYDVASADRFLVHENAAIDRRLPWAASGHAR